MKRRGQSIIEYTIFICVAVASLVAMQTYIKRGLQGKMRQSADEISSGFFYASGAMNNCNSVMTETAHEESRNYNIEDDTNDSKISYTETNASINRLVNHREEILPFSKEAGW